MTRRPPSPDEWPAVTEHALAALAAHWKLRGPRGGWQRAVCPIHGRQDPNLAVRVCPDGSLEMKCWSNECDRFDVLAALGVRWGDSSKGPRTEQQPPGPAPGETTPEHAAAIWGARRTDTPDSPAGHRIAARNAWGGPGDTPLPSCVAWIDRASIDHVIAAHDIPIYPPRDAAAFILYRFSRSDGRIAVQLDPLTTDGDYLPPLPGRKGRLAADCGPHGRRLAVCRGW